MPSRPNSGAVRAWLAAAAVMAAVAPPARAEPAAVPAAAAARQPAPDRDEITRALEAVKADPNLAAQRTIRTLNWVDPSQPSPPSHGLDWLLDLVRWIAESARVLVWVAAGLLVGLLAIYLLRLWRARVPSAKTERAAAPTHIQDLDIRPESLPGDIGASARRLWDGGEHRAALSLLYRGLLSRLVHVHHVPIRDSSTEGDALRLAQSRLAQGRWNYASRLVGVWQHSVYGGQEPENALLYALCQDFAPSLDAA